MLSHINMFRKGFFDIFIQNDVNRTDKMKPLLLKELNRMRELAGIISESESISEGLSIDDMRSKFVDTGKISGKDFEEILNASSQKMGYAMWLVKRVEEKIIKPEDIYKYKDYFKKFEDYKKQFPFSDIGKYKTKEDIEAFVSICAEISRKQQEDPSSIKGVSKTEKYNEFKIGSVDGFEVYELPKGRKDLYGVSCELGSGTEWCTATGKVRTHFDQHISQGPLFIFINPSTKEKYQFHYESGQFKDKDDNDLF